MSKIIFNSSENFRAKNRWYGLLLVCITVLFGQFGIAQTYHIVGSGTASSSSSNYYPAPLSNYFYGAKHQFFVTATQLQASGLTNGSYITSVGFNITTLSTVPEAQSLSNTIVKIYTTTNTNPISTAWVTSGEVAQRSVGTLALVSGWNQLSFDDGFVWNGTDNLVIETCFNNADDYGANHLQWTASGLGTGTWSRWFRADNANNCSSTTSTSSSTTTRPNMRFEATLPSCTGTPAGGTASSATGNPNTSFTLSVTGSASGSGLEYQWETSADGVSGWTDVAGATSANLSTTAPAGLGVTTHYRRKITCTPSGLSGYSSVGTYTSNATLVYCASVPTSNDNNGITNVTVGATSFPVSDVMYYDYTATTADISAGILNASSVTFDTGYSYYTNVWIDLNDNGVFESSELVFQGESVQTGTSAGTPTTLNTSFMLSPSAALGQHKMRIGTADSGQNPPNSCYSGTYGVTIDLMVNVLPAPSCLAPTAVTVNNIQLNSADISWTASTSSPSNGYDVYYSTTNTAPTGATTPNGGTSVSSPTALAMLAPATTYYVWVRANCGGGDLSNWSVAYSFTTACAIPDSPTGISFTSVTATGTTINYLAPSVAPTGYVIFRSTSNVPPVLANGTAYTTSQTAVVSSLTSGSNTYYCIYNGAALTGTASSLTSNTQYYYYVFSRNSGTCFGSPWYSTTALEGNQATAPAQPGTAIISAINTTTATVSWGASAVGGEFVSPLNYSLEVSTDSGYTNQITGSPFTGTAITQNLVGLTHSTTYYYRIIATNGANSVARTGSFMTAIAPASIPWTEGFATSGVPLGWTNTSTWNFGTSTSVPNAEGNYVYKEVYGVAGTNGMSFQTRAVGLVSTGDVLTFDYGLIKYGSSYNSLGTIDIEISIDNGTTYLPFQTITHTDDVAWTNSDVYDLSAYVGENIKIKITAKRTNSSGDYYLGFDNFYVGQPILCPAPKDLTATSITATSATLGWTSTGTLFDVEIIQTGNTPKKIPTYTEVANDFTTTNPLTDSTSYSYYVRQNCGVDGVSTWVGPYTFVTQCLGTTVPYVQDFSSATIPNMPMCTSVENAGTGNNWVTVNASSYGFTGKHLRYSWNSSNAANTWFYTQGIQLEVGKSYVISYDYGAAGFTEKMRVAYGTSPSNVAMTNLLANHSNISGSTPQSNSVIFTPSTSGVYYFGFNAYSDADMFYLHLDNINIYEEGGCQSTVTYTTSWSGTADSTTKGIVEGALVVSSDLELCELEVLSTGSVLVQNGATLTVTNGIVNNGTSFIVESGANLIQINDVENEGSIVVYRNSSPMKRLDYTVWSSPVSGQGLQSFSPLTLANRIYTYSNGFVVATGDFEEGLGYSFRAPNNYHATNTQVYEGAFTGVPHNGEVVNSVSGGTFHLAGNPYPSAIDADMFLASSLNPDVDALYFWTNVYPYNNETGTYSGNNYATYSLAGPVSSPTSEALNGFIEVGQGFFVGVSGDTDITFNNDLRTSEQGVFFRTMNAEKHRIWLNLSVDSVMLNQTMIAYMEGATEGVDSKIDSKMFGYEGSSLYNLIGDSSVEYVIQGRSLPFADTDVVSLGFKASEAGSYTISLANFDGLFSEGQVVYIKDNYTGTEQSLTGGVYTFVSEAGTFNNRFEVVYRESSMSVTNPDLTNRWVVYSQGNGFQVEAQGFDMKQVEVYDMLGRVVYNSQAEGGSHTISNAGANGVLIVKVTTTDNQILTRKVKN